MKNAIKKTYEALRDRSVLVEPSRWQSIDVSKRPEAATRELLNYTLKAQTPDRLDDLRTAVEPNLPWADDHFEERVSGKPLNPGKEWANWPWGNSANSFRTELMPDGTSGFAHSYMERLWPKHANRSECSCAQTFRMAEDYRDHLPCGVNRGIRYPLGDLNDVVAHLAKHPDSRQAYVPLWFPEDTGKTDVRVPCTLGYHAIHRAGYLHLTYYIRSCDLYRHFRDDVYLATRLQLWMLDELRKKTDQWKEVKPGLFTMHIVSLHCFLNDFRILFPEKSQ